MPSIKRKDIIKAIANLGDRVTGVEQKIVELDGLIAALYEKLDGHPERKPRLYLFVENKKKDTGDDDETTTTRSHVCGFFDASLADEDDE